MTNQVSTIKFTELGNSYWNSNGAYQAEMDELYEKLVPGAGAAETVHGELIRSASRLFYEYSNNGNCNAVDVEYHEEEYTCDSCGGSGEGDDDDGDCEDCCGSGYITEEEEGDASVTEFYQGFIDFIYQELMGKVEDKKALRKALSDVERIIIKGAEEYNENYFNDANMAVYDKVTDYVMWYVLNTENSILNNK